MLYECMFVCLFVFFFGCGSAIKLEFPRGFAAPENLSRFHRLLRVAATQLPLWTAAGLAQSVERLTAEREVAGSIPGAGPILRVLK